MIKEQMRITFTVEPSDSLTIQSSLSELNCVIEHVKWRTVLVQSNGTETGCYDIYIRFSCETFPAVSELLSEYLTADKQTESTRVRNVMAKNVQHGMRVEFENGHIGEVNQLIMTSDVAHGSGDYVNIGAPGGLHMCIQLNTKVRVHPNNS